MLVDPSNRLVADTLEGEWNEKLRALAEVREERRGSDSRTVFSSTTRSASGWSR